MLTLTAFCGRKGVRAGASERTYVGHKCKRKSTVLMERILLVISTYENVDTFFFGDVLDELLKNI